MCVDYLQNEKASTLEKSIENLSRLPGLLSHLKDIDPEGLFFAKITNKSELEYFLIFPSSSQKFWNCSRKNGVVDACHNKNQFATTTFTISCKDANDGNNLLGFGVFPAENKYYWHIFYAIVNNYFEDMAILMMDKTSGLFQFHSANKFVSNLGMSLDLDALSSSSSSSKMQSPVTYEHGTYNGSSISSSSSSSSSKRYPVPYICAIHVARNAQAPKEIYPDICALARAATAGEYKTRYDVINQKYPKVAAYLTKRKEDFCLFYLIQRYPQLEERPTFGEVSSKHNYTIIIIYRSYIIIIIMHRIIIISCNSIDVGIRSYIYIYI